MCVGEHINKFLTESGRTQKWLSSKTGIPRVKLNLSLHGKRRLTFEEYALICGALEVNTDRFIIPKVVKENVTLRDDTRSA